MNNEYLKEELDKIKNIAEKIEENNLNNIDDSYDAGYISLGMITIKEIIDSICYQRDLL